MSFKICEKCFKGKLLKDFGRTPKGNPTASCNECKADYQRIYQLNYNRKNREMINAKRRAIRSSRSPRTKNPEKIKIKCGYNNCKEMRGLFYGLTRYCKSHAFDKKTT
jgi:hypothetical protein